MQSRSRGKSRSGFSRIMWGIMDLANCKVENHKCIMRQSSNCVNVLQLCKHQALQSELRLSNVTWQLFQALPGHSRNASEIIVFYHRAAA